MGTCENEGEARALGGTMWGRLCWVGLVVGGCGNWGATPPCSIDATMTGMVEADWSDEDKVKCTGFGPSIDNSVDLYFKKDFTSVRVRFDWIRKGDEGAHDDVHVSVEEKGEKWASYDPVVCVGDLTRHEKLGKSMDGGVWAVEGSVTCDRALEPFLSEGTVGLETVEFAGGYTD